MEILLLLQIRTGKGRKFHWHDVAVSKSQVTRYTKPVYKSALQKKELSS